MGSPGRAHRIRFFRIRRCVILMQMPTEKRRFQIDRWFTATTTECKPNTDSVSPFLLNMDPGKHPLPPGIHCSLLEKHYAL